MSESYTGVQKAAILLITLGPEKAATIFKHLKEDEIEELTLEIANTRSVSPQTKEEILVPNLNPILFSNIIKYVLHSNILLRVALTMQKSYWKRRLEVIRHRVLSQN